MSSTTAFVRFVLFDLKSCFGIFLYACFCVC